MKKIFLITVILIICSSLMYSINQTDGKKLFNMMRPHQYNNPFIHYYCNTLIRRFKFNNGNLLNIRRSRWRPRRPRGLIGMLELTSGALALEATLQKEVMRHEADSVTSGKKIIPIKSLTAPSLEMHDFKKMMGSRQAKLIPSSRLIPHDWAFVTFPAIGKMFDLFDTVESWGGSFFRMMHTGSNIDRSKNLLMNRLGLRINKWLKIFYGMAVGETSLAISSPYLMGGTDMAVIFNLKNISLFEKNIKNNLEKIMKEIPGSKKTTLTFKGIKIFSTTSPCRRLTSFRTYLLGNRLGDYAVVANSYRAIKKIMLVYLNKQKAAYDNLDLQYLTSLNFDKQHGYAYMGDDFVRRITSPAFKIIELRRTHCRARLQLINFAMKASKLEKVRSKISLKKLIQKKYLHSLPVCPDRGLYTINQTTKTARCSIHGTYNHLVHHSSLKISKTTIREAQLYRSFSRSYRNYFQKYVDPVGIKIDVNKGIRLSTIILPLVDLSVYRDLMEYAGGSPITLNHGHYAGNHFMLNVGLKLRFLSKDSGTDRRSLRLRKEITGWLNRASNWEEPTDVLGWMNGETSIHMTDFIPSFRIWRILRKKIDTFMVRFGVANHRIAKIFIKKLLSNLGRFAKIQKKYSKYDAEIFKLHIRFVKQHSLYIALSKKSLLLSFNKNALESSLKYEHNKKIPGSPFWKIPVVKNFSFLFLTRRMKQFKNWIFARMYYNANKLCAHLQKNLSLASSIIKTSNHKVSFHAISRWNLFAFNFSCPLNGRYFTKNGMWHCTIHDKMKIFYKKLRKRFMNYEKSITAIKSGK